MKKILFGFFALFMMFGWNGCIYDFVAPEDAGPDDPTDSTKVISFATQIQPAFTDHCVLCHKTGKTAPDLIEGKAYNAINNSKYINTASPAQSLIYRRSSAAGGFAGHPTLPSAQAALLLGWIQQGAKNN